jgi:hypothetical protein
VLLSTAHPTIRAGLPNVDIALRAPGNVNFGDGTLVPRPAIQCNSEWMAYRPIFVYRRGRSCVCCRHGVEVRPASHAAFRSRARPSIQPMFPAHHRHSLCRASTCFLAHFTLTHVISIIFLPDSLSRYVMKTSRILHANQFIRQLRDNFLFTMELFHYCVS